MSTATIAPPPAPAAVPATPAPVAAPPPATPAAKTPNPSPKSPIPPGAAADASRKEAIAKVWGPDPAKTAPAAEPVPEAKTEPAAPTKTEAAPVTDFPEDRLPEPKTEAAKAGWTELKAIAKQERQRAASLEQQIAELKKAPATAANTSEIEALRAEVTRTKEESKAALDRLLILDLQNHPDFHKQFVEPRKKAFAESATLLADNGITEAPDFNALLTKPRAEFAKTVSELAAKMNSFDAQTFTANMRQAYQLAGDEKAQLAKAGDVHQQLQQKALVAQRNAFESVVSEVLPNFEKMPVTPEMDAEAKSAAEAYNASVDGLRSRAEATAFGRIDEKAAANLSLKAVALDHMIQHALPAMERGIKQRDTMIAQLATELKSLRGGRGPVVSGGDPSPSAPPSESIESAAKRLFNRT